MEPYSIVCTTCQSRLRVRKASAVGEILACPKCGSMVLITPPPNVSDSHADSHTDSHSGSGSGSATEISSPAPSASPPKTERKQRFRGNFPPPPGSASGGQLPPSGPILPNEQWSSPTAQRIRQWGLLAAAALLGIMLAIAVVSLVAKSMSARSKPSAVEHPTTASANGHLADATPGTPSDKQAPNGSPTGHKPANEPESPHAEKPPSSATPSSAAPTEPPHSADAVPAKPKPVGDNTSTKPKTPDTPSAPTPPSPNPAAPPATPSPPATPNPASPAVAPASPAPPSEDVKARLAVVLISIEFESVPLAIFADFVRNMTGIPVTLDLDAIRIADMDTETELAVDVRGITVRQAIQAALKPHELAMVIDGNQIVFTTQDAVDSESIQKQYVVTDLAPDAQHQQDLAVRITRFVAPAQWQDAGGQGQIATTEAGLIIDQQKLVHFQIARFLDRLRVARGLLPRTDVPRELVDLNPVFQQAATELAHPITVHFDDSMRVARALQFLQAEIGAKLLVNWRAAASVGWLPSTKTRFEGRQLPLEKLLQRWLQPQKLEYRVFDPKTIQITSQVWLEAHPEVEFYPLKTAPENATETKSLLAALRDHVGTARFVQAGGKGRGEYDSESRCLIVLLPQPAQRMVARWLADQNSKTAL